MPEIQIFKFKNNQLRSMIDAHGEPWFVAKDACDILAVETNHLRRDLDSDEITEATNLPNWEVRKNGGRAPLIVSEPGLYKLIMRSRKQEAKEFQRWVTHEVLPSIRKHGGYMAGQESMTPEQMTLAAMNWLRSKVDEQQRQLEAQAPKVLFADAVSASKTDILVGELAKILKGNGIDMGGTRLFAWLRENGWLMKTGSSRNMPTQKSMELGLFRIKETEITHSDGHITVNKTPKVTGKGQAFFREPVPLWEGGDVMKVRDAYRLAVRFIGYGATLLLVGGAIAVHLTGYVMAHDESLMERIEERLRQ